MTSNRVIRRVAKPALFAASLWPAAWLVTAAFTDRLGADPLAEITNTTGIWTLRFLCVTLAMTPLRRISGWNGAIRFRRMLGLFAFFYGTLHLLIYLMADRLASLDLPDGLVAWQTAGALVRATLFDVAKRPFITVGMAAWLSMLPLALTSTAWMIRRLGGRRWQLLHRLTYVAAAAGAIHYWWLVKADVRPPERYAFVLGSLFLVRALWWAGKHSPSKGQSPGRLKALLKRVALIAAAVGVFIASETAARPNVSAAPLAARFTAVAFDYLVLFNPDSIVSAVERVAPHRSREFTTLWRTRQFEYCWLRSITNRYVDFSAITEDSLEYTAHAMQIALTPSQKHALLESYLHLAPWPDAEAALQRLRQSGVRIITISNFSPPMLRSNAERAGLLPLFDALVSSDANRTYKPDPRAYQLGVDRLDVRKDQIVFAAFAAWDAAGAKSFGYPTIWVNRSHQPPEDLGIAPDRTVADLEGLMDFVLTAPTSPSSPH